MPTQSIDDLNTRERGFFFRALAENSTASEAWRFEGSTYLGGRFGFFTVINPRHPFRG